MAGSGLTLDLFENDGLDDNMREGKTSRVCPRFFGQGQCKMEQPFTEKKQTMGEAYLRKNYLQFSFV